MKRTTIHPDSLTRATAVTLSKGLICRFVDPETGEKVDMYNPRTDSWSDHFALSGGMIVGLTPIGRATVRLLHMNDLRRVELRLQWLEEGGRI